MELMWAEQHPYPVLGTAYHESAFPLFFPGFGGQCFWISILDSLDFGIYYY